MADGYISQIQLPPTIPNGVGKIYNIKDANVGIDSEYIQANYEVVLTVGSLGDADSTEY